MIKDILIPTDFSECAAFALEAGLSLARQFEARVTLFHRAENWPGRDGQMSAEEGSGGALEAFFTEKLQAVPEFATRSAGLELRYACSAKKPFVEALCDFVKIRSVDLIVMGSHGASGKNEYFIGSNTQKVVRAVHRPVLVIKERLEKLAFDKVVFASNFQPEEEAPFLRFKEIVRHFVPEFHFLTVRTGAFWESPPHESWESMKHFAQLAEPFKSVNYQYPDFNVDQGIRTFAREIGASLIGISNRNRHPLRRLLIGSNVEALVNHASLPVLSIDYEE